jgi:alkaline phosphatase
MDWAQQAGKATGIVTNTRITHASPAGLKTFSKVYVECLKFQYISKGTYAKTANRDWECDADMKDFTDSQSCIDIAKQLIRCKTGQNFNVIYGGGRKKFICEKIISDEDGKRGQRTDGLDLIDEWLMTKNSSKSTYIHNREGIINMNHTNTENVRALSRNFLECLNNVCFCFS